MSELGVEGAEGSEGGPDRPEGAKNELMGLRRGFGWGRGSRLRGLRGLRGRRD